MERIARIWVAFILFGGLSGLFLFLGLVFGLGLPHALAATIAVIFGVSVGFALARSLGARKLAARILGLFYYLGWLTN